MGVRNECPQKRAFRLEGTRLKRSHIAAGAWTPETIDACEDLANRILGHTQGCRDSAFRSYSPVCELPSSHLGDVATLSKIVYMTP